MAEQNNIGFNGPGTAVEKVPPKLSLIQAMAARFSMEPAPFLNAVKSTVFPNAGRDATDAQVAAFLAVAHEYGLNPFTRELFAFPNKSGGITPIVSIDGWVNLIVRHPQYNGMDLKWEMSQDGKPISCTCTIFRKDIEHSVPITEYFAECFRATEPWTKMPMRMLRHKAIKESGRVAFGFSGITDEDEAGDIINITAESSVLERSTEGRTERLKEKIGAKKAEKEPMPVEPPPAKETVALITEAQRQEFLDSLSAKAAELGADKDTAMAAGKGFISGLGFKKSKDLPAEMFPALMEMVAAWTIPQQATSEPSTV
jgi:phage recombination protein Bet